MSDLEITGVFLVLVVFIGILRLFIFPGDDRDMM